MKALTYISHVLRSLTWRWAYKKGNGRNNDSNTHDHFELRCYGFGRCRATVWLDGTWHTWDADGVGGENASAYSVAAAQRKALESCYRQHFISGLYTWLT